MSLAVYISGPITAETPEQLAANIQRGAAMAKRVWEWGHGAHCPHLNSSFPGADEIPHAQYMEFDLRMLAACDAIIMLEGWEMSVGAEMEYRAAKTTWVLIFHEGDPDLQSKLAELNAKISGKERGTNALS